MRSLIALALMPLTSQSAAAQYSIITLVAEAAKPAVVAPTVALPRILPRILPRRVATVSTRTTICENGVCRTVETPAAQSAPAAAPVACPCDCPDCTCNERSVVSQRTVTHTTTSTAYKPMRPKKDRLGPRLRSLPLRIILNINERRQERQERREARRSHGGFGWNPFFRPQRRW